MEATDIQMCVADCLRDDEVESLDGILRALNDESSASWRAARGGQFAVTEAQEALKAMIASGMVTPCTEKPPTYELRPVTGNEVGTAIPWESLWFRLEPSGHDAVAKWWEGEGRHTYPRS